VCACVYVCVRVIMFAQVRVCTSERERMFVCWSLREADGACKCVFVCAHKCECVCVCMCVCVCERERE